MPLATSFEVEALILAARRTIEPAAVDRLRKLLVQGIDWEVFTRLTFDHGVTLIAFRSLNRAAPDLVPSDIAEASCHFEARQSERNAFLFAELIRIQDALERDGIGLLPFKGPVLSYIAYGDVASRQFADLDFLIRDGDVLRCLELLGQMGYRSNDDLSLPHQKACLKYYGQSLLHRDDGKVAIEPHWAIAPATFALSIDYAGMWRRAMHVDCAGQDIPSLSPEDLFTVLCIHGSKHEWTRLQWICDLGEVLRAYPEMDWGGLLQRAREQRCLRMVLIGLSLVEQLTGYVLPPSATSCDRADKVIKNLSDESSQLLFATDRESPSFARITPFRISMRDHWTDKVSYVWRTIVLPREDHLRMVRLPESLFFGYYPIKIVHDYLMLPVWLALKKVKTSLNQKL
jgi:hypothetical protein